MLSLSLSLLLPLPLSLSLSLSLLILLPYFVVIAEVYEEADGIKEPPASAQWIEVF